MFENIPKSCQEEEEEEEEEGNADTCDTFIWVKESLKGTRLAANIDKW